MRVPRRTASEHAGALEQLYGLLYPDGACDPVNDERYRRTRSKGTALVRLWLNRSACPHAVESTSSLIHAQQLDEQILLIPSTSSSNSVNPSAEWLVRSTYSMAIIRFVNSVVDTYQTALYAQSIFQISSRIGLPAYLVELRHAATHEDLPSLDVLRDACRDALQWLQRFFWLPTLAKRARTKSSAHFPISEREAASSEEAQSSVINNVTEFQASQSKELGHLIARYRRLAKKVVKDESLKGRYKASMVAAQAAIEQCGKRYESTMRQVRSAPQGAAGTWTPVEDIDGTAASFFAEALLEEGGIIPLSKRKRPRRSGASKDTIAKLPSMLMQIWLPLLNHLAASADDFADVLQVEMVSRISSSSSPLPSAPDKSYIETVASWLMALFGDDKAVLSNSKASARALPYSEASEEDGEAAAVTDKPTLLLARRLLTGSSAMSLSLVRLLCAKDEQLNERISPLLDMAETALVEFTSDVDIDTRRTTSSDIDTKAEMMVDGPSDLERSILEMEAKLRALEEEKRSSHAIAATNSGASSSLAASADATTATANATKEERIAEQNEICKALPGWRVAPSEWKPTPIGCLDGVVPDLYLEQIEQQQY